MTSNSQCSYQTNSSIRLQPNHLLSPSASPESKTGNCKYNENYTKSIEIKSHERKKEYHISITRYKSESVTQTQCRARQRYAEIEFCYTLYKYHNNMNQRTERDWILARLTKEIYFRDEWSFLFLESDGGSAFNLNLMITNMICSVLS